MGRILALLGAAALCVFLTATPDLPQSSMQRLWAEGSPDSWSSAGIGLSAIQDASVGYMCPMDRDVSSKTPGFCPRCGMKLVSGIPEAKEYPVAISTQPRAIKPGENIQLIFGIEDPKTHQPVSDFEIVHEKFYHLFIVSQDLSFFLHTHPEQQPNASFRLAARLPQPGMYRILSDFYPKGGTPQLVVNTLMVRGSGSGLRQTKLAPELAPQRSENEDVELVTHPAQPVAGGKTLMYFRVKPNDGIEPYLGAMAHMLAASSDLVDMIHSHPIQSTDHGAEYKQLQFNMTFPSAGIYRVWVQSQRKGVVNTVAFNVPVRQN
jgi:hypothetical protein